MATTADGTRSSRTPESAPAVDTVFAAREQDDGEHNGRLLVISTRVAAGGNVAAGAGDIPPLTPPEIDERASATASGTPTPRMEHPETLPRGLDIALVRCRPSLAARGKRPSATGPDRGTAAPAEVERNCVRREAALESAAALREAPDGLVLELAAFASMVAGC